jgi:hypothetical protein
MSALGQKRTLQDVNEMSALPPNSGHEMAIRDLREHECSFGAKNVRFTPRSGHFALRSLCPLWANSGLAVQQKGSLFDHLVGRRQQLRMKL